MPTTSVPVTDAFDESEPMEQLEAKLPPAQIEWLEEMAANQGVNVGHVLRTVVMAQMRTSKTVPSAAGVSGDAMPPSSAEATVGEATVEVTTAEAAETKAAAEAKATDTAPDTSERDSIERGSDEKAAEEGSPVGIPAAERRSDSTSPTRAGRSMFDMVEG